MSKFDPAVSKRIGLLGQSYYLHEYNNGPGDGGSGLELVDEFKEIIAYSDDTQTTYSAKVEVPVFEWHSGYSATLDAYELEDIGQAFAEFARKVTERHTANRENRKKEADPYWTLLSVTKDAEGRDVQNWAHVSDGDKEAEFSPEANARAVRDANVADCPGCGKRLYAPKGMDPLKKHLDYCELWQARSAELEAGDERNI
jgi:hypothetical protein